MSRIDPPTTPDAFVARPRSGAQTESRYEVEERIAAGGMGVVYRVKDRVTGETRALKRMSADSAGRPALVEAFQHEYRVLVSLDHPRIIRAFDYAVDEEGPCYTMEYLEGADMRQVAPLEPRVACGYLRDIATSLALIHARRLIHRDLSPSNVRLTEDGHCKLLDFGALTSFGTAPLLVGTPPGVPPEALAEAPLDQRADLYALGALAYWMLTKRHAYPARRIRELPELWGRPLAPPSSVEPAIPRELDRLILSLLSADPLARPASAGEVISRLQVIGDLPDEDASDVRRVAQSFLLRPRFTGRAAEVATIEARARAAFEGRGGAVRIQGAAGMGRTRLLEEVGVRAQLDGAVVLRADASMHRQGHGTVRELVMRAFDALPEAAREHSGPFHITLAALGRDVEARLPRRRSDFPGAKRGGAAEGHGSIERWLERLSGDRPLVVLVDNVEYADTASIGVLAGLAATAGDHALFVVVTEKASRDDGTTFALSTLRAHATPLVLTSFQAADTLELVRSLFGDAPGAERFAEWLHGRAAGSPLYTLEITRQLLARNVLQYEAGVWTLPVERPDTELPTALEDALSLRVDDLGPEARRLAESLSLQDHEPTLELCRLLVGGEDERPVLRLLDELARSDVLHAEGSGYRFSSTALREALLSGMDPEEREQSHRSLGEAFATLSGGSDPALLIEAGWHLIHGADELRGAGLIAKITHDASSARSRIANLHHMGRQLEAALRVFQRHRRPLYERMPLLAALAHAGYYEDRHWGERYGDEALDALEYVSGLRTAGRLRPFLGRWLSLIAGMLIAVVRFFFVPRSERPYSFKKVIVDLLGTATALTGAASLSLDVERARRTADVLEPFSVLPERLTPRGIYQFCRALEEIGQEHEARAFRTFDTLVQRFDDLRYYPSLPLEARRLYISGAHFARGAFAIFRADGKAALESADALDASGNRLYQMIGSQLRFLYHVNRGELAQAAPHRLQVDLYAAQVGSAWQVDTWEAPSLILVNTTLVDVVECGRVARRIEAMSQAVPSLRVYARLAREALRLASHDGASGAREASERILEGRPPRSFIGWGAVLGYIARSCNYLGEVERAAGRDGNEWFEKARRYCHQALSHLGPPDLEYVAMFLGVEIELARADAALGDVAAALARVDAALARHAHTDHPLVHGLLHEARAVIAWGAGDEATFTRSAAEAERWFRPTGTPLLVARCERLAALRLTGTRRSLVPQYDPDQTATVVDSPGGRGETLESTEGKTVRTEGQAREG